MKKEIHTIKNPCWYFREAKQRDRVNVTAGPFQNHYDELRQHKCFFLAVAPIRLNKQGQSP